MSEDWKRLNTNDFDINLDDYDIETFVPGLKNFIKEEINTNKIPSLYNYIHLKASFKKWKSNKI